MNLEHLFGCPLFHFLLWRTVLGQPFFTRYTPVAYNGQQEQQQERFKRTKHTQKGNSFKGLFTRPLKGQGGMALSSALQEENLTWQPTSNPLCFQMQTAVKKVGVFPAAQLRTIAGSAVGPMVPS